MRRKEKLSQRNQVPGEEISLEMEKQTHLFFLDGGGAREQQNELQDWAVISVDNEVYDDGGSFWHRPTSQIFVAFLYSRVCLFLL